MAEQTFHLSEQYGSYKKSGDVFSLQFERIYDHPVGRVWEAITRPEQLAYWLGTTRIDPREGGEISVQVMQGIMGGRIIEYKENQVLEYIWWKDSIVRYELFREGEGRCRLLFTHSLLTAGHLIPAATGWHFHMDMLSLTLDGRPLSKWPVNEWEEVSRIAAAKYTISLDETEKKSREASAPFVIERIFDAPVRRVWKAITDKDEMKHWCFDIADFEPEVGYEFVFYGENEGVKTHFCRITEVIPNHKLAYSWRYKDIAGISLVTFELFPEGARTRLRLTHEGLENFAHAGPIYARHNFVAGWTGIFDKNLKEFLASRVTVHA